MTGNLGVSIIRKDSDSWWESISTEIGMLQCVTWPDPRGLLSKDIIVSLSWRVISGILQLLARVLSMKLPAVPESINAELLCQPLPQEKCIIVENPAEDRGSVISLVSAPLSLDEKFRAMSSKMPQFTTVQTSLLPHTFVPFRLW